MAELNQNPDFQVGEGGEQSDGVNKLQRSLNELKDKKRALTCQMKHFDALLKGSYTREQLLAAMEALEKKRDYLMLNFEECVEAGLGPEHPSHGDTLRRKKKVDEYREIFETRLADFNQPLPVINSHLGGPSGLQRAGSRTGRSSLFSLPKSGISDSAFLRNALNAKVKNDKNELRRKSERCLTRLQAKENIQRAKVEIETRLI